MWDRSIHQHVDAQHATAVMMMPVATSILRRFPTGPDRPLVVSNFCRAVILGVLYSITIGGMSTWTGTGVNLILIGMWKSYFPQAAPITLSTWFCFAFPSALLMFLALWALLCCLYCSRSSGQALSVYLDKAHLKKELELLVGAFKLIATCMQSASNCGVS